MEEGECMRKEVKICLYRVQDYDLYTLYFDPVFPFRDAIRLAVTAFAEGAPTPRIDVSYVERLPLRKPRYITVTFTLYSDAAIRMVEAASAHGRNANNLVKNLLRRALVGIENIYFDPEDAQYYAGRDTLSPRREPHGKPSAGGNLRQEGGRRNSSVHKTLAKDGHRQRVDGGNDGIDEGDVRDTGDVAGLLGKEQGRSQQVPARQADVVQPSPERPEKGMDTKQEGRIAKGSMPQVFQEEQETGSSGAAPVQPGTGFNMFDFVDSLMENL